VVVSQRPSVEPNSTNLRRTELLTCITHSNPSDTSTTFLITRVTSSQGTFYACMYQQHCILRLNSLQHHFNLKNPDTSIPNDDLFTLHFNALKGAGNISLSMLSTLVLGPIQHPNQWVPGAKWSGHEADHSPPTSAKVKIMLIYTSTPIHLHATVFH
jgi:hypothetical protein